MTPLNKGTKGKVMTTQTGKVKWFNNKNGYGFLEKEDGSGDIFVHITAVQRSGLKRIQEGETYEFESSYDDDKKKQAAENLRAVSS